MKDTHVLETLPILILYPHSRCDCRCVMCDIWKVAAVREIDLEDLERQAKDIEALGVRRVVFSGGEPLMHADLCRLCDYLRLRDIRTTVLSTGLLLAKHAPSIAQRTDDVIVSLDGPPQVHDRIRRVRGAYQMLAAGIRALHAQKPDYPVGARCTVQRQNFSLMRETVKTARELGLQSISFLAADLVSTAFNRPEGWPPDRQAQVALTAEETRELEDEIGQLIAELPEYPGFVLETPEKLRRIGLHFRAHLGLAEPVSPRCNAPWVSAVIESDGTVRPCFFHRPIGNVRGQTLAAVINGPQAVEFRRTLNVPQDPICRRCVCSLYLL